MKLMISQPMRGKTNEQILEERKTLVNELKLKGHTVIDTVFGDFPTGKDTPLHYLAKSIEFLAECDGLVMMSGWNNSRGCIIEFECAKRYNKFIMEV